jgi:hypothetical protein
LLHAFITNKPSAGCQKYIFVLLLYFALQFVQAQIGIGTPTPNASLDIISSNPSAPAQTDGILIPRLDAFLVTNPTGAQNGILTYLTMASKATHSNLRVVVRNCNCMV